MSQIEQSRTSAKPLPLEVIENVQQAIWAGISGSVRAVLHRLVEMALADEATERVGAARHERDPGRRAHPNGTYTRDLQTTLGPFPYVVPYLVGAVAVSKSPRMQRFGDRVAETMVVVSLPASPDPGDAGLPPVLPPLESDPAPVPWTRRKRRLLAVLVVTLLVVVGGGAGAAFFLMRGASSTSHVSYLSSGDSFGHRPGDDLGVGSAMAETAVEDADPPVRERSQRTLGGLSPGAVCVVVAASAR